MTDVVHVNHRSAGSPSLLIMDVCWLLVTIIGLATTGVSCAEFGIPPSLPEKGLPNVKKKSNTVDSQMSCITIASQLFNIRCSS